MIYPSFSPTDDLSLSFAAAATAPTQRDPNAEGQSITCALCSSHPGLGHDDNDDQHHHPDVNENENVVHIYIDSTGFRNVDIEGKHVLLE